MAYCTECAKLVLEVSRLNYELGKSQGELEGLRAGWSMSNHEAWEQGHHAGWDDRDCHGPTTDNPFPKPEKAGE
jgi:hypothetical protein